MGDEVGWLRSQPRAAKMPQQAYGQGVAGMPQECHGWVKRLQGRPEVRQKWARAAVELQEMWVVAQPPEAKVRRAAKPHLWVAQLPQPWAGSLA